jgi:hypothetical protein
MSIQRVRDTLKWPALVSGLTFAAATVWRRADSPTHTHWPGMLLLTASFFLTPPLVLATIPRWQSLVAVVAFLYGLAVAIAA